MASIAEDIAALRGTKPATFKDLLKRPTFARLAAAMTVSSLGDWVGFVAVAALVSSLERSASAKAFAVAGMMMARLLPSLLFGPFAGVLVDRVDRKRLMITADISRGVMYGSMPFLKVLPAIFALSFLIECLSLVWGPAKDSSIPNIVPRRQLENANTIGLAATYGTLPLGGLIFSILAGISGWISDHVSTFHGNHFFLPLWLDAGTFAFSALMVSKLNLRGGRPKKAQKFEFSEVGRDIKEGVQFLRQHSLARAMTIGIVMGFVGVGSVIALGPIFATQTLHGNPSAFGVLVTAVGIGMGVGMASLSTLAKFIDRERLFPMAMLGAGIALIVVSLMPDLVLAAVSTVVLGLFVGITWVTGYAMLQENVADEFRGRTFAALNVMGRLGLFASLVGFPLLTGVIGDHGVFIGGEQLLAGTRIALWTGALVVVSAGFVARRGLRRHRRPVALLGDGTVPHRRDRPGQCPVDHRHHGRA